MRFRRSNKIIKLMFLLMSTVALFSCSTEIIRYKHESTKQAMLPKDARIAIFPIDSVIREKVVFDIYDNPLWMDQSNKVLGNTLLEKLNSAGYRNVEILKSLNAPQQQANNLWHRICYTLISTQEYSAWSKRFENFDYSLDSAVNATEYDYVFLFRMAQVVAKRITSDKYVSTYEYPEYMLNFSKLTLTASLVDTKSNQLLWFSHVKMRSTDSRNKKSVHDLVALSLSDFDNEL